MNALKTKLSAAGFAITVAADGEQALRDIKKGGLDFVILDLILPLKTGFEVLGELKKEKNTIPVLVLSDLSQEDDVAKVLELGAIDFFLKSSTSLSDVVKYVSAFFVDPKKITLHPASKTKNNSTANHVRTTLAASALKKYLAEIEPLKKGFDLLQDHVIITDPHAHILYANKAVEKRTGFTVKEVLGRNPADLWGGRMPKEFYERMWQVIAVEKKPFVGEVRNIRKDGRENWQELHIAPVLDGDGEIRFFIGVEPDITERKKLEQFKEEFISVLGHQLKNPLASIRWALESLGNTKNYSEKERETLKNIYAENKGLISLVSDLLILAKLEKGEAKKESFDLGKLLKDILVTLKKTYPSVGVHLKIGWKKFPLLAHKTLTQQLFVNIFNNACEYIDPKKQGRVDITLTQKGSQYLVTCRDNGVGIPTKEQAQIFQRFFRASNATPMKSSGSGLGLFIAKFIADQHGWDISFTSATGKGTTFFVTIPLLKKSRL